MRTDQRIASKKELTKRLEDATRVKIDLQLFAGELIGSVLHHTGMRNLDLAEKLGITNVHLSMVKTGKTRLTALF